MAKTSPPEVGSGLDDDPFLSDRPNRVSVPRRAPDLVMAMALASLVAGILAAVVIGSRVPTRPATALSHSVTTSGQLASHLIAATDLPSGWNVYGSVSDATVGMDGFGGASPFLPGCLSAGADQGRLAEAEVELVNGPAEVPLLSEAVAEMPPARAPGLFATIAEEISACQHVTAGGGATSGGAATSGDPVVGVAVPPLGDQSAAWQASVGAGNQSVSAVLIVVREGNQVLLLEYGSYGPPLPAVVVPFADMAVTKLG
ncbi:MAG: hypothetical protein ACRDY0_11915 [Acidimicrobiales bacterium]